LRSWQLSDAASLQRLADDFDVVRWTTLPHPYRREDAEHWVATALENPSLFAIEVDGKLAGGAAVMPSHGVHEGVAVLGYWVAKQYWNCGVATAVVGQLVERAFAEGFRRVEAHVFVENAASARVLEKCGFQLEAALRSSYVDRDGTPGDELIYARFRRTDLKHAAGFIGLDHVQLAVPAGEEERAGEFYVDLLGFEPISKPTELKGRGGVWLRSGTARLHLGVDPDFRPAKKAHPALQCTHYDWLLRRLVDRGIAIVTDDLPFNGRRRCYICDPFGNRIELIEA
jgi:RimJ/RimL family protein N-acetyltransferase/catechol 2,3-dioxygenase-like lactoylglutathione lyase family enzyme